MTQIIIKAVRTRKAFIEYLAERLPDAKFCFDEKRCAFDTFLRSLEMAGQEPAIHMEEDIFLTRNFQQKIEAVIAERPDTFIQFFSMRGKDLTEGSRWDNNYLMNQCFYAPAGYSKAMLDYYPEWAEKKLKEHPNGTDLMICDFLKSRKEKYWIHCPSLVEHRIAVSEIDKRRSSKRQSKTFTDLWD